MCTYPPINTHMQYDFLHLGSSAYIIDENNLDHEIDLDMIEFYIAEREKTVKVEGLEEYYLDYLPSTVHCYISPKGAPSFPLHLDPYDVTIKCIEGEKTMIIDDKKVVIKEGEEVLIPANTPHQATNESSSVILSIGQ